MAVLRLKTTIFLLDGANGEETEAENKDKNEHGVENDKERKHTRNDEEEDSDDLEEAEDVDESNQQEVPHQSAKAGRRARLSSQVEEESVGSSNNQIRPRSSCWMVRPTL